MTDCKPDFNAKQTERITDSMGETERMIDSLGEIDRMIDSMGEDTD